MTEVQLDHGQLNELELLLGGALGVPRYSLPDSEDDATLLVHSAPEIGEELRLLDSEGTPVARVIVTDTRTQGGDQWVAGAVTPDRPIEHRQFAELRVAGPRHRVHRALLVEGSVDPESFASPHDLVIVPDDGGSGSTATAVAAALAAGSTIAVLPVPASRHLDAPGRALRIRRLAALLMADEVVGVGVGRPVGRGLTVLFTGFSGSGKSTIAKGVADRLALSDDRELTLLDGDEVRTMLSAGLGFSRADRELNVRRIGWVAAIIARHGGIALCAPIAPYESMRTEMRRMTEEIGGTFVLVHVATPIEVCEARDRKGLYAKARKGELVGLTGVDDPYDIPRDSDLRLDTSKMTIDDAVAAVLRLLEGEET